MNSFRVRAAWSGVLLVAYRDYSMKWLSELTTLWPDRADVRVDQGDHSLHTVKHPLVWRGSLKELDTFSIFFFAILQGRQLLFFSCLRSCKLSPFWKGERILSFYRRTSSEGRHTILKAFPAGTQCWNNVDSTSWRWIDVVSTLCACLVVSLESVSIPLMKCSFCILCWCNVIFSLHINKMLFM